MAFIHICFVFYVLMSYNDVLSLQDSKDTQGGTNDGKDPSDGAEQDNEVRGLHSNNNNSDVSSQQGGKKMVVFKNAHLDVFIIISSLYLYNIIYISSITIPK